MKPTGKIGRLLRFSILTVKSGMGQASSIRFAGAPAFTKWNFARVLAMGALMSAGAVMYFNLASEGAASAPSTEQNGAARPANNAATYVVGLNNDDEWRYGPPYIEDFSADAKPESPASPRPENIPDDEWRFDSPYHDDFQSISARSLSKEVLAVYQRDDDEWLYRSPFRRNWDDFSARETAGPSSIGPVAEAGASPAVYPGDDEWMYGPPYIQIFPQP